MHQSNDIMMTKTLMKSHETHLIEFFPFLEKNVVAMYDDFERLQLICSILLHECGGNE